jgi:hypothetical protein
MAVVKVKFVMYVYGEGIPPRDLSLSSPSYKKLYLLATSRSRSISFCSARDWDDKDYLRIIPRVVW